MPPTDQRLDVTHLSVVERDHRLVVHLELAALDGAPQLGLGLEAVQRGLVHRRLEHAVAATGALRDVHRGVGIA